MLIMLSSTQIRFTAIPDSSDIVPVRNQIVDRFSKYYFNVTLILYQLVILIVSIGELATSSYTTTSGY